MDIRSYLDEVKRKREDLRIMTFERHSYHRDWISSVLFFAPNFLVTGSLDQNVIIMESKSGKWVNSSIDTHIISCGMNGGVRSMIKWDENTFLVACENTRVYAIDLKKKKKIKTFGKSLFAVTNDESRKFPVFRLLKLQGPEKDLFIAVCGNGKVQVISYSGGMVIQELEDQKIFNWSRMELSRSKKNCFFLSVSYEDDSKVKLIDYKEDRVIKEYPQSTRNATMTINSFINRKTKREILVLNTELFYDVETGEKICSFDDGSFRYKPVHKFTSLVMNNDYLLCGDDSGNIVFHETPLEEMVESDEKSFHQLRKSSKQVTRLCKRVLDIAVMSVESEYEFKIAVASIDGCVYIVRVRSTDGHPIFLIRKNRQYWEMLSKNDVMARSKFICEELLDGGKPLEGRNKRGFCTFNFTTQNFTMFKSLLY